MLDEPCHFLGRTLARGNNEITLVLTSFVVHDDDEFACLECRECFFYGVELECRHGDKLDGLTLLYRGRQSIRILVEERQERSIVDKSGSAHDDQYLPPPFLLPSLLSQSHDTKHGDSINTHPRNSYTHTIGHRHLVAMVVHARVPGGTSDVFGALRAVYQVCRV